MRICGGGGYWSDVCADLQCTLGVELVRRCFRGLTLSVHLQNTITMLFMARRSPSCARYDHVAMRLGLLIILIESCLPVSLFEPRQLVGFTSFKFSRCRGTLVAAPTLRGGIKVRELCCARKHGIFNTKLPRTFCSAPFRQGRRNPTHQLCCDVCVPCVPNSVYRR